MTDQNLSSVLESILKAENPGQTAKQHVYGGFNKSEMHILENSPVTHYQGKVREVVKSGQDLFLVHTDRLSAFDKMIGNVPYKGVILASIAQYWFDFLGDQLPHHSRGLVHERVIKAESMQPIKVEMIVRNYLAGSMLRAYEKGERTFCGQSLPDGLKPYGKLPKPIITPTTKAEVFEHDENTTPEQLIANKVCTQEEWDQIANISLKLFDLGTTRFKEIGWILVDTKYEFGRSRDGSVKIIDEVHTPDSSRLWSTATYDKNLAEGKAPDMFDKEVVRRYLMDEGFSGEGEVPSVPTTLLIELAQKYLQIAEDLSGRPLTTEGVPVNICQKFLV